MSKISKIIICFLGIILGAGIICATVYYAYQNNSVSYDNMPNINNKGNMRNNGENNNMTPPDMSEEKNMTPPDNNENNTNDTNNKRQRPNDANNSNNIEPSNDNGNPPQMNDNQNENRAQQNKEQGNMKENFKNFASPSISLTNIQIIIIAIGSLILIVSILYLIMSGFGSKDIFISKDKVLIFILLNIIVSAVLTFGIVKLSNDKILNNDKNNVVAMENVLGSNTNTSMDNVDSLNNEYS